MYKQLDCFKMWCQKVLPLVYDDSLSYYEVLCKVVDYINNLIESDKEIVNDLNQLNDDMKYVMEYIENFDTEFAEKVIREYLATMIFITLNDDGYIVYYIPASWSEIDFKTTGLDIELDMQPDYGHLVLSY